MGGDFLGDRWEAGRKAHWRKVLNGTSRYWGFDYRKIFNILVSVHENDSRIEKEDNEAHLRQYVSENQEWAVRRFEKAETFQDKVRYAFYARLTVLWRIQANWLKLIPMDFHGSFAEMFDFWLKGHGPETLKQEETKWIEEQTAQIRNKQLHAVAEFLEISDDDAEEEIVKMQN